MFAAFEVLTIVLVAVAMALALAHALELPGKMRLSKRQYLAVQPIYYPGFTFGGIAEPVGILLVLILLSLRTLGTDAFWLTAGALVALVAMHAAYWLLTHPVNNFWLRSFKLRGASASFFFFGVSGNTGAQPDWKMLRDRWEYSHVVRAGLGLTSLILLAAAMAI